MPQNNQRTLKVEASGDFWKSRIKPKIRLCGHWLDQAGFKPGRHVRVTSQRSGELTLQLVEIPPAEATPHA